MINNYVIIIYMNSQLHQGLEDYKKQKSVREYLAQHEFGELTFAPYNEVKLTPPQKNRKKRDYSPIKHSQSSDMELHDDDSISDHPTHMYSERFESNMDYENNTVSSEASSCLSTDGTLLIGECFAPPGKLGIAIDTIKGQPVVHRVREESPLSGVLRRLDIIVGVDDIDTSKMSAADVTTLMARKMDQRRKITYMRGQKAVENLTSEMA